jgi:hypothetical protein
MNNALDINTAHLSDFVEYLVETQFRGVMPYSTDQSLYGHQNVQSEQQNINESKIRDLGILTVLAMLRIDLFVDNGSQENKSRAVFMDKMFPDNNDFSCLSKIRTLIKNLQPNPTNSIVLIALQEISRQLKNAKMADKCPLGLSNPEEGNCLPFASELH